MTTDTDSFYIATGLALQILCFFTKCMCVYLSSTCDERQKTTSGMYASVGNIVLNFIKIFALAPCTI